MSKMSELAAASDLADLIKGQASAMNQTMMNGYDAGLQEGFRRGIQAAADLVSSRWTVRDDSGELNTDHIVYTFPQDIVREIRALKP